MRHLFRQTQTQLSLSAPLHPTQADGDMLRLLADSIPQLAWVTRSDGYHEYYNRRWYEFTGMPEGSTDGDGWNGMFHPDDRERARTRWQHSLATGEAYAIEYRLRRADGHYCWVLGRALPVRDATGTITRWYGTCTDISEQRQREEFIQNILDHSPDCIKVLDLEGRLLSINQSGLKLMEVEGDDSLLNQSWRDFWPPEEQAKVDLALAEARDKESYHFVGHCLTARGKRRWWEVSVIPLSDAEGRPDRVLSVSRDITERKDFEAQIQLALEEARLAREKAEAANAAKSDFLANMSHELRTPMNAVVGLATILSKDGGLTPRQAELMHTLRLSAQQLLQLINDLLDIAKLESHGVQLEQIPFPLAELLTEVVSIHALTAETKGIELELDADLQCPTIVIGDPMRLRQVVMNLVGNAVKFTERGKVRLSLTCDRDEPGQVGLTLAVSDSGIGIAADKLESIFSPFAQADSSMSRKYGGTGLGLSITKTLVELMGGEITVESQLGKGSCFTLRLSLPEGTIDSAPLREAPISLPAAPHNRDFRVLLVEDYKANLLVATLLLESFGYAYAVAETGEDALKLLEKEPFDLILMDVQMPGMNGFDATREIRRREADQTRHSIIVGMTAHALSGDRERCLNAGMDDYLSKPFQPEALEALLLRYAGGEA